MTTYQELYDYINAHVSHVIFEYNGKNCGIDPFSNTNFDVWYGDKIEKMTSIEDVFHSPFFDGKSLADIIPEIDVGWD